MVSILTTQSTLNNLSPQILATSMNTPNHLPTQPSQLKTVPYVSVPADLPQSVPSAPSGGGTTDPSGLTPFVLTLIVFAILGNNLIKK
jgi:hypothetical protein